MRFPFSLSLARSVIAILRGGRFAPVMRAGGRRLAWRWASGVLAFGSGLAAATPASLQVGVAAVDITPPHLPVIVSGYFTERRSDQVTDRLQARALVLQDARERLALVVVDSLMLPRDLIDQAKEEASRATGLRVDRMLVAATHTHAAPSAMGALGTSVDEAYAAWLPAKIAEAIIQAAAAVQPAEIGWTSVAAPEFTHNRRWLRRPDRVIADPFGQATVRANMHPGYQSPDVTGPSGPVDPELSILAARTLSGQPLALLANYSQHYFGAPPLSADYYGTFARKLAQRLGQASSEGPFLVLLSQGTSGDLMWMDYGAAKRDLTLEAYASGLAEKALEAYRQITWKRRPVLGMVEKRLTLDYRRPDEARLAWAREKVAALAGKAPRERPDIYAREALYLHERPAAELKLQALRIGDLSMAALPNEVFAITGLKLKRQSPFGQHFNVGLANGAEGYIPPPEQHRLGGYTTWPARTAGLAVEAEPRIVQTLLGALEELHGGKRRPLGQPDGAYARAVLAARPVSYWRMHEINTGELQPARPVRGSRPVYEGGVALYLEGPPGEAFSQHESNRSPHFAGGRVRGLPLRGDTYSVSLWLWNALPADARPIAGYAFSRGVDGDSQAGDHLGIGGTYSADGTGRLLVYNGNRRREHLTGRTALALRTWYQVTLVREGRRVRVYLNGDPQPEIDGELEITHQPGDRWFVGGRNDGFANFEGKIDEVAIFARALPAAEVAALYQASGRR